MADGGNFDAVKKIGFGLEVFLGDSVKKAFDDFGELVAKAEQQAAGMRLQIPGGLSPSLSTTPQPGVGTPISRGATTSGPAIGQNGNGRNGNGNPNGNGNGNGNYFPTSTTPGLAGSPTSPAAPLAAAGTSGADAINEAREQAARRSTRRIENIRRESDERMRIEGEQSAALVERANQEALQQQVKDLRKAEQEKQKEQARTAKEAERAAAAEQRQQQRQINQANRERAAEASRENRGNDSFWTDFERYGQRSMKDRQRAEAAEQRLAERAGRQQQQQEQRQQRQQLADERAGHAAYERFRGLGLNRDEAQTASGLPRAEREARERQLREERRERQESERSLGEQREGYRRLNESIGGVVDSVTRLGEGMAYLGLAGDRDLRGLADSLLRIRGTVESLRGGFAVLGGAARWGQNFNEIRQSGGMGGVARAILGLGPRAAGSTGILGTGITGAGLATAGIVTAGTLAAGGLAAHLATGGASTTAGGRGLARLGIWNEQTAYNWSRGWQTMFMDEGQRQAFERADLYRMENPYAVQSRTIVGGGASARAAAAERNTGRLEKLQAGRKVLRDEMMERQARENEFQAGLRRTNIAQEMMGIQEDYRPGGVSEQQQLAIEKESYVAREDVLRREQETQRRAWERRTGRDEMTGREIPGMGTRDQTGQLAVLSREDQENRRNQRFDMERQIYELASKRRDIARQELDLERQRYETGRAEKGNFTRLNPLEQQQLIGIYRQSKGGQTLNENQLRALEASGISRFQEIAADQRERLFGAMFQARGGTAAEASDILNYEGQRQRQIGRERTAIGEEKYNEAYRRIDTPNLKSNWEDKSLSERPERNIEIPPARVDNKIAITMEAGPELRDEIASVYRQVTEQFVKNQSQQIKAILEEINKQNAKQLASTVSRINQQGRLLS